MMAQPVTCDMCSGEVATLTMTNMANGDVMFIGDNCQLAFYITAAETIIDGMPAEAVTEYADAISGLLEKLGGIAGYRRVAADDVKSAAAEAGAYQMATGEAPADVRQPD